MIHELSKKECIMFIFFAFVLSQVTLENCHAKSNPHLYVTGKTMEVDRCASAWLIKRFVDKEAVFKWLPKSSLATEGTVFDRPEGNLQRTCSLSSFEVILNRYNLTDERLVYMGSLINDIEVNFWGKRNNPESRKFELEVGELIDKSEDGAHCDVVCFQYFDQFFSSLNTEPRE